MSKNDAEYIPQFDTNENEVKKTVCRCCGKSVNETAVNNEGFCAECVLNNRTPVKSKYAHPDKSVHERFCKYILKESKKKNKSLFRLFLPAISSMVAILTADEAAGDITKNGSFNKNNKKTVYIRDEAWACPCCMQDNYGPHYCERCGVYPEFKLID